MTGRRRFKGRCSYRSRGKIQYETVEEAKAARTQDAPNVYICHHCMKFHLTKQEPQKARLWG